MAPIPTLWVAAFFSSAPNPIFTDAPALFLASGIAALPY